MEAVDSLLEASLKSSTRNQYHSGWSHYEGFCTAYELDPFDASEAQMCCFLAWMYLHPSIKAFSTYNKYLTGVASTFIESGLPDPSKNRPILTKCKRGLRRLVGTARKERLPVTIALLRRLRKHWSLSTTNGRNSYRMAIVAVNGCFRLGELASSANNLGTVPLRSDFSLVAPNVRSIFLRTSKVDPFGAGSTIFLAQNSSSTCPVRHVDRLEYKDLRSGAPLFQTNSGSALKASMVISYLRRALAALNLPISSFSGHSFRKGGVQTLVEMGASEADIKALGRWTSDCWKLYVTWPISRFTHLSSLFAAHR